MDQYIAEAIKAQVIKYDIALCKRAIHNMQDNFKSTDLWQPQENKWRQILDSVPPTTGDLTQSFYPSSKMGQIEFWARLFES